MPPVIMILWRVVFRSAVDMRLRIVDMRGQTRLTTVLLLLGAIVAGVWIWKRITPDQQDYLVENIVPLVLVTAVAGVLLWSAVRAVRRRVQRRRQVKQLLASFDREAAPDKRLGLAFALIEVNEYRLDGLERVAPAMQTLFVNTVKTALGDKQHRIRGMAASHLGIIRDVTAVPVLMQALEDDHAYVRACAALALGRMRAVEAKAKLEEVMKEDWDQTVRSRAREALERML